MEKDISISEFLPRLYLLFYDLKIHVLAWVGLLKHDTVNVMFCPALFAFYAYDSYKWLKAQMPTFNTLRLVVIKTTIIAA